jgi:hypothetical protein
MTTSEVGRRVDLTDLLTLQGRAAWDAIDELTVKSDIDRWALTSTPVPRASLATSAGTRGSTCWHPSEPVRDLSRPHRRVEPCRHQGQLRRLSGPKLSRSSGAPNDRLHYEFRQSLELSSPRRPPPTRYRHKPDTNGTNTSVTWCCCSKWPPPTSISTS